MLSLHKLEIFAIVVQEGSFSAAAAHLYMSQPAVSKHIQDLERALGTRLFERGGAKGTYPTDAGHKLYEYTTQILSLLAEAECALTNVENLLEGQINVGATAGAAVYMLPQWINRFRSSYPRLSISLQTDTTGVIAEAVASRRLDLGLVEGELDVVVTSACLEHLVLQDIDMYLVVGKGHPWCERESVSISELHGQPFITRQRDSQTRIWLDELFKLHGVQPDVVAEFDSPDAIKNAALSGMGLTLLPNFAVERESESKLLRQVRIADATLKRQLKLIWNGCLPMGPIGRAFVAQLRDSYPHLTEAFPTSR